MDPHIGLDHSWHTWTRADGSATLLATPYTDAITRGCPMEAYRPIFEDAGWTQAGSFEWTLHSRGWAHEWANNTQVRAWHVAAAHRTMLIAIP